MRLTKKVEDVVKALHVCTSERTISKCSKICPYHNVQDCRTKLMIDAADTIEDLIAALTASNEAIAKNKPRWIPVTERLPEDGKFVLVCNDDGHMMIAKHETETYEWYYKYTNYDFDIWDNEEQGPVRYWMPLPEPPKEETE